MHYYQFNIGDYVKSTRHLTPLEDIAYRRLLDLCYDTEKPLSLDVEKLSRLIGMKEYQAETQQILKEFFKETKKGFIQIRVQKEIAAYSLKAETSRTNGAKGGRPKKTHPVNSGNPEETQQQAKQETVNNKQETITPLTPQGVDAGLWADFLEMRKKLKAPNTDRSINSLISKLDEFKAKGHDPNSVVQQSYDNGWKGIFEPKGTNNGKSDNFDAAEYVLDQISADYK